MVMGFRVRKPMDVYPWQTPTVHRQIMPNSYLKLKMLPPQGPSTFQVLLKKAAETQAAETAAIVDQLVMEAEAVQQEYDVAKLAAAEALRSNKILVELVTEYDETGAKISKKEKVFVDIDSLTTSDKTTLDLLKVEDPEEALEFETPPVRGEPSTRGVQLLHPGTTDAEARANCSTCIPANSPQEGQLTKTIVELAGSLSTVTAESRTSPGVRAALNYAQQKAHATSQGACYCYVKRALIMGGLISPNRYPPGGSAHEAKDDLAELGFNNIFTVGAGLPLDQIRNAPEGAVLVYDGGEHGHAEIKIGRAGESTNAISDFRRVNTLRNRRLIGIMIPPDPPPGPPLMTEPGFNPCN